MTQKTANNAQRQNFVACTLAGDITEFPHLVAALHATLGPAWGHLELAHGAAYLATAQARALGFAVIALDDDALPSLQQAQAAVQAAHAQDIPVILVGDLTADARNSLLDLGAVRCVLPLQVSRAQMDEAVAMISRAAWETPEPVEPEAPAAPQGGRITILQGLASGRGTSLVARGLSDTLALQGTSVCLLQFTDDPGAPGAKPAETRITPNLTRWDLPHAGTAAMAAHLPRILTEAAAQYDHVVVDLPPVMIPAAAQLLPLVDTYFAMAEITPRAAQNTRALRRVISGGGRSLQDVRFVMNRVLPDDRSAARMREMAAALCIDIAHVLPDARPASDLGRLRPGTALAHGVARMAAEVAPHQAGDHRAA